MSSYAVRFWDITKRADRNKSFRVRWAVAGREHEDYFTTKALANSFRSVLMQAARSGESFDETTGLPQSQTRARVQSRSHQRWLFARTTASCPTEAGAGST